MSTASAAVSPSSLFPEAKHFVSKDHFQYYFGVAYEPVVRVLPGDLIHVETNDCFHGRIHPEVDNPTKVLHDMEASSMGNEFNPITGPIYVEGAMPGDVLVVRILDIQPRGVGVACCGPDEGQLCHWTPHATTKFFDLSEDGTIVTMRDEGHHPSSTSATQNHRYRRIAPIAFPASPMLGVIGVAPACGGDASSSSSSSSSSISTMPAGKHGGNLDNNCNGIGSTLYIPVNHPGALLSIGDMHASQGDGEVSGNGVEIGGHVLLQCDIIRQEDAYFGEDLHKEDEMELSNGLRVPIRLEYPVTETATHWITHGVLVENIPQTTVVACEEAAKILVGQWGFTMEEAFIFLSVQGNLGFCQSCHPDQGTQIAKMSVRKANMCPRPFRILYEKEET